MGIADMRKPDEWSMDEIRQVVEVTQKFKSRVYANQFWRMLHESRAIGCIKGGNLEIAHSDRQLLKRIIEQYNFLALVERLEDGEISRTEAATLIGNEKVTKAPVFSDRVRVGVVGGGRLPLTIGENILANGAYLQVKPEEIVLDFEGVVFVENGECLTQWKTPPTELQGWLMVYRGHGDKESLNQDDEGSFEPASEQKSALKLVTLAKAEGLKTAAFYDYDPWGIVLLNSTLDCFTHYVRPVKAELESWLEYNPNFNKSSVAQKQLARRQFQTLQSPNDSINEDKRYMHIYGRAITQECIIANDLALEMVPMEEGAINIGVN